MTALFVYGYGNDTMVRFLHVLKTHDITGVLDLRDESLWIRDEFDPANILDLLKRLSITYAILPELVIPPFLVDRPRTNGSSGQFLREYAEYLDHLDDTARTEVRALLEGGGNWLILCAEEDPTICHRRIAADFIATVGELPATAIIDIGPAGSAKPKEPE